MIEDTSFIIDILHGEDRAIQRIEYMEAERRPEKVSAITALELYEGITLAAKPEAEHSRVLDVLESKTVLAADSEVMANAGSISGDLFVKGAPIDREDCIVAATALREGEPVITRNEEHFGRVPDLEVLTY